MKTIAIVSFLCTLFSTSSLLRAIESGTLLPEDHYTPWLTGTLLALPGSAYTAGHFSVQPFFSTNVITGNYNAHWKPISSPNLYEVSLQVFTIIGLNAFMDINFFPKEVYNHTKNKSSTRFEDLPIGLDFQLLPVETFEWFPGIKLGITETFPTGKYQKLNPKKLRTDIGGTGSFATSASLVFYKVYHIKRHHFLSMTATFSYTYSAPVHVQRFNSYGGGFKTRGKVFPGGVYFAILSFEYALTQNWVLALDNLYTHNDKDRFRGKPGFSSPEVPATVGDPSSESLSLAPAIEYNFSANLGIIAGVWFSLAGRNAPQFRDGIISVAVYY